MIYVSNSGLNAVRPHWQAVLPASHGLQKSCCLTFLSEGTFSPKFVSFFIDRKIFVLDFRNRQVLPLCFLHYCHYLILPPFGLSSTSTVVPLNSLNVVTTSFAFVLSDSRYFLSIAIVWPSFQGIYFCSHKLPQKGASGTNLPRMSYIQLVASITPVCLPASLRSLPRRFCPIARGLPGSHG